MRLKIKNNGDTIVEVLIAVAVLMVVITGGYSIATRSLNGARISQERSEATMIAQGQLEAVYQRVSQAGNLVTLANGTIPGNLALRGSFIGVATSADKATFTGVDPDKIYENGFCVDDNGASKGLADATDSAGGCAVGSGLYKIKITTKMEDIDTSKKYLIYNVNVNWDKAGGGTSKEEVNLVGRYVIQL